MYFDEAYEVNAAEFGIVLGHGFRTVVFNLTEDMEVSLSLISIGPCVESPDLVCYYKEVIQNKIIKIILKIKN